MPGAGYAALHPELKDIDPEDYPDINKMAILADVAPYSREYTRSLRPDADQKPRARARPKPDPRLRPSALSGLSHSVQGGQARSCSSSSCR